MVETINKMNRVGRRFLQEHGREATNEELAKEMGISVDKIREAKKAAQDPISLETPIGEKRIPIWGISSKTPRPPLRRMKQQRP